MSFKSSLKANERIFLTQPYVMKIMPSKHYILSVRFKHYHPSIFFSLFGKKTNLTQDKIFYENYCKIKLITQNLFIIETRPDNE